MRKRIFVAEDDKDIAYILNTLLTGEGYEVDVFNTLTDLKTAMAHQKPDLLLMDIMLPDGNGLDLCREIKNAEEPVLHPIFMMSAAVPLEKMVGKNGADAMISKPFKLDFVLNTIKCYISGQN